MVEEGTHGGKGHEKGASTLTSDGSEKAKAPMIDNTKLGMKIILIKGCMTMSTMAGPNTKTITFTRGLTRATNTSMDESIMSDGREDGSRTHMMRKWWG